MTPVRLDAIATAIAAALCSVLVAAATRRAVSVPSN